MHDTPLAYVEHFSDPPQERHRDTLMYEVRRLYSGSSHNRRYKASIVPLSSIHCSCHLIPKFGKNVDLTWTSDNVLDMCDNFFVNDLLSLYMYQIL